MIVSFDYSMTCPCMCILADDKSFSNSLFYLLSSSKKDVFARKSNIHIEQHELWAFDIERYDKIASYFIRSLESNKIFEHVGQYFIEGYSMGSKGRVFAIAENTAVLKHKLYQKNVIPVEVSPMSIKKYATGKGTADKDKMYESFINAGNPNLMNMFNAKFGVGTKFSAKVGSPVSDIVDSYYLALYGANMMKPSTGVGMSGDLSKV
jgi:hypothetical protein